MFGSAILRAALVAVCAFICAHTALAQSPYPTRPVRIIVPFPPGGINDFAARSLSTRLTVSFGLAVIIDNRPGAGGVLGTDIAAKATPDGYTFIVGSIATHAINQSLRKDLPYNVLRDFIPITNLVNAPNLLVVHPGLSARSVKELIALAKSKPGVINYGSAGSGTSTHMAAELFKVMTGTDLVHVPYKGAAPSVIDLLSGQVSVIFSTMPSTLTHVKAGRLRALAVTGRERSPSVPDMPTIAEAGVPGYEFSGWAGLFAPARTPRGIVDRLYGETHEILQAPDVKERFFNQGAVPGGMPPQEFAAFVKAEIVKWEKVVRFAGARQE